MHSKSKCSWRQMAKNGLSSHCYSIAMNRSKMVSSLEFFFFFYLQIKFCSKRTTDNFERRFFVQVQSDWFGRHRISVMNQSHSIRASHFWHMDNRRNRFTYCLARLTEIRAAKQLGIQSGSDVRYTFDLVWPSTARFFFFFFLAWPAFTRHLLFWVWITTNSCFLLLLFVVATSTVIRISTTAIDRSPGRRLRPNNFVYSSKFSCFRSETGRVVSVCFAFETFRNEAENKLSDRT